MRIKIIRGIYGHQENGNVVEKSHRTGAFDVSSEEAVRLISMGVAVKAGMEKENGVLMEESCMDPEENGSDLAENGETDALEDMRMEELQRMAGELGLKKNGSKRELAERIRECLEQEEIEDDDMPVLHPAEVE